MSAKTLYERLIWVAFRPRQYIDVDGYFGPDRRFKIEGYPEGKPRRKGDFDTTVDAPAGPSLEQDDIDALFASAKAN